MVCIPNVFLQHGELNGCPPPQQKFGVGNQKFGRPIGRPISDLVDQFGCRSTNLVDQFDWSTNLVAARAIWSTNLVDQFGRLVDQIALVDQFGRPTQIGRPIWSTNLVARFGNQIHRFSRFAFWRHEIWSTNLVDQFGCRSTNLVDQLGQPICCHNWSTNLVVADFVFGRPIGRPNWSTKLVDQFDLVDQLVNQSPFGRKYVSWPLRARTKAIHYGSVSPEAKCFRSHGSRAKSLRDNFLAAVRLWISRTPVRRKWRIVN